MKISVVSEDDFKKRLDVFIVDYFKNKYPRSAIDSFIEQKNVIVNNKKQKSSYKLKLNDLIEFDENLLEELSTPKSLTPWDFTLDIRYEDDDIIVINKPKGVLTHPTKYERNHTLSNALLHHCTTLSDIGGADRLGIVHRLDKNTAGLMVAAKNNTSHTTLSQQIKEKITKRKYKALALGDFEQQEGIIDKPLVHYLKDDVKMMVSPDGLSAITNYKVLEQYKGAALVELELKTGRTHQIRAHLASINHPVFGDSLYGAKSFMRNEFYNLKTQEQLLQSYYLGLIHPKSGEFMEFSLNEDEFSEDFIKVLRFLRSKNNV